MLSFSPTIELGCTCTRRDFRLKENPSYNHKEMSHFKSLRGSMTAYKVDLLCECGVSATFNISDLTLFNVGDDSRSNPFEERWDNEDQPYTKLNHAKDPLKVPSGLIRIVREKKYKEALNRLVRNIWSKMDLKEIGTPREHERQPLIHLIQVQEEPNSCGSKGCQIWFPKLGRIN
jgi:hypothetical protein